jgi:DNA-binding ferritin-like protein
MDNVVNLSAFGDIIEKPKKDGGEEFITFDQMRSNMVKAPTGEETISSTDQNKNLASIFGKILQNSAQIKLLHWQTNFYGQHKALDAFWADFNALSDTLAETIMGKFGKPTLDETEGCLTIHNYKNPENGNLSEFIDHLYKCYDVDCRTNFSNEKDSEIINIIDEIVALIDQNRYLLSLK